MIILAIESSCDESSLALFEQDKLIKCIVSSQIDIFKQYGGVVPEVSSRLHVEGFKAMLDNFFKDTKFKINDITNIVYTENPGLNGPLMIGKNLAQTIALYLEIPITPVNHIHGHILSVNLTQKIEYPALAAILSGGHTQLATVTSETEYEILGETLDDAIGESYDKVARLLDLDYPGGPEIDKRASKGKNLGILKMPMDDGSLNFSFSGIKSQAANLLKKNKYDVEDFCCTFQETVVGIVMKKIKQEFSDKYKSLIVVGGVSANSLVRSEIKKITDNAYVPELKYTGDNAAMIGLAGYYKIKS